MSRLEKDRERAQSGFSLPIHMAPLTPSNGPDGSVSPIEKDKEKKGEDGYSCKPQRQSSLPSVVASPTKEAQAATPRAHTTRESRESRESREKKDKKDKKDKKKSSRDPGHTPRERKSLLKTTSTSEVKDKDSLIRALVLRINELEQSEKDLLQRLTEYEQRQLLAEKEKEKERTTAPRDTSASRLGGLVSMFRSNKKTISLSDITIGEKLGAGGSNAVIFSCYIDGWQCAMKELDLEYMNNEGIAAFEGEIRLLELLPQHPNIVRYLFHENKNKKLRLFMTRYSTTLHHEISTHKPQRFPAKECMKYALDIVRGLEFLHSHHIIHRDLKSENIFAMLNDRREITRLAIGDFDTAKKVSAKNQAKTVLGTPQWMAPEVLSANDHGGSTVDDGSGEEHSFYSFPADIYSFGMVLYELLAMKPPYDGCKPMQISMNILSHRLPAPPTDLEPEFQPLLALHLECTKANPSERPSLSSIKEKLLLSGS